MSKADSFCASWTKKWCVCQESTGQGRLDSGGKLVKADKVVFAASLVLESLSLVKRCLSTHDAGRVPFPRVGGLLLPAFWRLETKAGPGVLVPAVFQVTWIQNNQYATLADLGAARPEYHQSPNSGCLDVWNLTCMNEEWEEGGRGTAF